MFKKLGFLALFLGFMMTASLAMAGTDTITRIYSEKYAQGTQEYVVGPIVREKLHLENDLDCDRIILISTINFLAPDGFTYLYRHIETTNSIQPENAKSVFLEFTIYETDEKIRSWIIKPPEGTEDCQFIVFDD